MNIKWKVAFFISLTINVLVVAGGTYILLMNTLVSGHNYDNLITVTEDLDNISDAIQQGAYTIGEFDSELKKVHAGHWTDKEVNLISLQILGLIFDDQGSFTKIETYYMNNHKE